MARTGRVHIMLEEDMKEKFKAKAFQMGLTESALGAYIIGQWIVQQEAASNVIGSVQGQLSEFLKKEVEKKR